MTKIDTGQTITCYNNDPTIFFSLNNGGRFNCIYATTGNYTLTMDRDVLYWNFGNSTEDRYITFYDINGNKLFELEIKTGVQNGTQIGYLNRLFDLSSSYNNQWKVL